MNQLKAVTYAESREAFFIKMLNKAERGLENLMKYGTSHDDRTEQGQIVAFYRDALAALREQAERSKGCEHCKVLTAEHCTGFLLPSADPDCEADMVTISHCPMCGKRLEVKQDE